MNQPAVGYQFLIDTLRLGVLSLRQPARIATVSRVQETPDARLIPGSVAPSSDNPIDHILFALKHEGTQLDVLAAAFRQIEPGLLVDALRRAPTSGYARKACYLFEKLTGKTIEGIRGQEGTPVPLFDPARYVVSAANLRDPKWRVDFNGLGNWSMCPTIRKTEKITQCLESDILERAKSLFENIAPEMADRALAWAYLNETKGSFAIEREVPQAGKAEAFAHLLRQAWEDRPMDEDRLAALQSATMSNPLLRAVQFRTEQNHLQSGAPGAIGVRYVPPPPDQLPDLMNGVLLMANGKGAMHPLVRASLASFGFVYAHPFMDGNGRLSRFLVHYVLAQANAIPNKGVLPISVAMNRNELRYLHALEAFSRPARDLWDVMWIDGSNFHFDFKGDEAIYRYWDATEQTEFLFDMAAQSLQRDLIEEVDFLKKFDAVYRKLDRELDLQGRDLANLIRACHDQDGKLSKNRRKQYALTVPEAAFDAIEALVKTTFFDVAALDGTDPQDTTDDESENGPS
jgi:hypothetical protein